MATTLCASLAFLYALTTHAQPHFLRAPRLLPVGGNLHGAAWLGHEDHEDVPVPAPPLARHANWVLHADQAAQGSACVGAQKGGKGGQEWLSLPWVATLPITLKEMVELLAPHSYYWIRVRTSLTDHCAASFGGHIALQ